MSADKEIYLGDGVYASFDGFQIKLRAPRENGNSEIFIEPAVYINLLAAGKTWGFLYE